MNKNLSETQQNNEREKRLSQKEDAQVIGVFLLIALLLALIYATFKIKANKREATKIVNTVMISKETEFKEILKQIKIFENSTNKHLLKLRSYDFSNLKDHAPRFIQGIMSSNDAIMDKLNFLVENESVFPNIATADEWMIIKNTLSNCKTVSSTLYFKQFENMTKQMDNFLRLTLYNEVNGKLVDEIKKINDSLN